MTTNNATQPQETWTLDDWRAYEIETRRLQIAQGVVLPVEQRLRAFTAPANETFTFFWETESPFSQWYRSEFTGPLYLWNPKCADFLVQSGLPARPFFTSAEQFMMFQKALLFLDLDAAKAILDTHNPRKIKELGRAVQHFAEDVWQLCRVDIVYTASHEKFTQNAALKGALLATAGTTLVEASPFDAIWGIGLDRHNAKAQQRATWEGTNLLGEILTLLREDLSA